MKSSAYWLRALAVRRMPKPSRVWYAGENIGVEAPAGRAGPEAVAPRVRARAPLPDQLGLYALMIISASPANGLSWLHFERLVGHSPFR